MSIGCLKAGRLNLRAPALGVGLGQEAKAAKAAHRCARKPNNGGDRDKIEPRDDTST